MLFASFWTNLAQSLGLAKQKKGAENVPPAAEQAESKPAKPAKPAGPPKSRKKTARDVEIEKHVLNLKNDSADQRRSAAWSLGKMKPPAREALDALMRASEKDSNEMVRYSAQWAVKVIRGGK